MTSQGVYIEFRALEGRGLSSVGRAVPCQGTGRRFEPVSPLHSLTDPLADPSGATAFSRLAVREDSLATQARLNCFGLAFFGNESGPEVAAGRSIISADSGRSPQVPASCQMGPRSDVGRATGKITSRKGGNLSDNQNRKGLWHLRASVELHRSLDGPFTSAPTDPDLPR